MKKFESMLDEYNYIMKCAEESGGQSFNKWVTNLLGSIAHSLAVIADNLDSHKGEEPDNAFDHNHDPVSEVKNEPEKNCYSCKYRDCKNTGWPCIDCLDNDRWELTKMGKV